MTLTQGQALGIGALIVGVLAFCVLSPWSPVARKAAGDGWDGVTWSPTQPLAPHLARGGLWHPPLCGEGRTGLLQHGWAWVSEPPPEVQGPGVSDA